MKTNIAFLRFFLSLEMLSPLLCDLHLLLLVGMCNYDISTTFGHSRTKSLSFSQARDHTFAAYIVQTDYIITEGRAVRCFCRLPRRHKMTAALVILHVWRSSRLNCRRMGVWYERVVNWCFLLIMIYCLYLHIAGCNQNIVIFTMERHFGSRWLVDEYLFNTVGQGVIL